MEGKVENLQLHKADKNESVTLIFLRTQLAEVLRQVEEMSQVRRGPASVTVLIGLYAAGACGAGDYPWPGLVRTRQLLRAIGHSSLLWRVQIVQI